MPKDRIYALIIWTQWLIDIFKSYPIYIDKYCFLSIATLNNWLYIFITAHMKDN